MNWLRRMFKDVGANTAFAGVYMTGILPIKNYDTQTKQHTCQIERWTKGTV